MKFPVEGPVFTEKSHPEANGREPKEGEVSYSLFFPLEDGTTLTIKMGDQRYAKSEERNPC